MRKELDERLCAAFPHLYYQRNGDLRTTALCWGFQCGDGWFQLLWDLSAKLEPLCIAEDAKYRKENPEDIGGPYFCVSTVKEKYGTLRVYLHHSTDEMEELLNEAEDRSATVCESCGSAGAYINAEGYWKSTRCVPCRESEL